MNQVRKSSRTASQFTRSRVSTYVLSCRSVGSRPVLGSRFGRIKSRTFNPFGFPCRDEPPLPSCDRPFRSVRLTHGRKQRLAACDIRTIRALPRVDKFCCPVPIAMPARDPFAAARQAARTGPGEQKQVLFSCPRGRYASVTLTKASDADERGGLSRRESETQQDDESDHEFNPPDTVARHVPLCAIERAYSWLVCDRGARRAWREFHLDSPHVTRGVTSRFP
jgi:hypothetical protein